jgi:hypothetical protein
MEIHYFEAPSRDGQPAPHHFCSADGGENWLEFNGKPDSLEDAQAIAKAFEPKPSNKPGMKVYPIAYARRWFGMTQTPGFPACIEVLKLDK